MVIKTILSLVHPLAVPLKANCSLNLYLNLLHLMGVMLNEA